MCGQLKVLSSSLVSFRTLLTNQNRLQPSLERRYKHLFQSHNHLEISTKWYFKDNFGYNNDHEDDSDDDDDGDWDDNDDSNVKNS